MPKITKLEEWRQVTIGDVAEVVTGGTPATKNPNYWGDDIVWVTTTEVAANDGLQIFDSRRKITAEGLANSSAKLLPIDSVVVTTGATIGAVALAGVPMATKQGCTSLLCGEDILPRFAMYWFQKNTNLLQERAAGTTFLDISRKKFIGIPMKLPPPPRTKANRGSRRINRRIHRCSGAAVQNRANCPSRSAHRTPKGT